MTPDFNKDNGLLPAIIQDADSQQVLMLGYMNEAAFLKTRASGLVTFYSRSRQSLWVKGETSGNYLQLQEMYLDCDRDTILVQARPAGPVCHTGSRACFSQFTTKGYLYKLQETINSRIEEGAETSYTSSLYKKGINKIAQKVGEEAVELIIEAKDDNRSLFLEEAADLLFHYLLLLKAKNVRLEDVEQTLRSRAK